MGRMLGLAAMNTNKTQGVCMPTYPVTTLFSYQFVHLPNVT